MATSNNTIGENNWIYHERQQAALCGQHALNNLCQAALFSTDYLSNVAHDLDMQELAMFGRPGSPEYKARLAEGSGNVDQYGNFSIQVLQCALANELHIDLVNIVDQNVRNVEPTQLEGFICHHQAHWFAIRKINDRYWNLNSFLPKPETVSHFKLATELRALQAKNYTIFVALPQNWQQGGLLPPPCTRDSDRSRGKMKYWWNEQALLQDQPRDHKGGINSANTSNFSYENTKETTVADKANATQDPWLTAGKGQRLGDIGKKAKPVGRNVDLSNMTEDEMISLAMEQSMGPQESEENDGTSFVDYSKVTIKPEPDANDPNATKIQLKLPQNKRVIRRFLKTDTVKYVHAVVAALCPSKPDGKYLQLSAGFPPSILDNGEVTLESANLLAAAITARLI